MLLMHSGGKKTTTSRNFLGFSYDETYYAGNQKKKQVFGAFPDGNSTLMLVASRLRHIAGTRWSTKRYLNMDLLKELEMKKMAVA